jgi:Ca2+/Na+ antiporter
MRRRGIASFLFAIATFPVDYLVITLLPSFSIIPVAVATVTLLAIATYLWFSGKPQGQETIQAEVIPKDSSLTDPEIAVLNTIYSASALTEDDIYSRLSLEYRTLAKQQDVIYGLLRKPEGIISTRQTKKGRVFYLTSSGVSRIESGLMVGDKADRQLDHLEVRLFYPWYFFIHLPFLKRDLHNIPRHRRVINWVTQKAYWMGDSEDNLLKNGNLKWFSERKPYFSSNLAAWAKKNKLELVERTPMRSELRRIAPRLSPQESQRADS